MSETVVSKPKTLATLTNTNADVWHLLAASGQRLGTLRGVEKAVMGPARASLIADHGLPEQGEWVRRGPGRHSYVAKES